MRLIVKAKVQTHPQQASLFSGKPRKAPKKAGPFIGPRGGKWQDAKHTIAWKDDAPAAPQRSPGHEKELELKRFQSHVEAAGWDIMSTKPGQQQYQSRDREWNAAIRNEDGQWRVMGDVPHANGGLYGSAGEARAALVEGIKAEKPATEPTRAQLKEQGFITYAKSSDLFSYGYSVVHWLKADTFKTGEEVGVTEYKPRNKGGKRFVASTTEEQIAMHNWVGAPITFRGDDEGEQAEMFEAAPEERKYQRGSSTQESDDRKRAARELATAAEEAQAPMFAEPEPVDEYMRDRPEGAGSSRWNDPVRDVPESAFTVAEGPAPLPMSTFLDAKDQSKEMMDPEGVRTTPGTKMRWYGVVGYMEAYHALDRRRSSAKRNTNLSNHINFDLSKEIGRETSQEALLELRGFLKEMKHNHGGAAGSAIRAAIAGNEILVNNRIRETSRGTPKLSHEERRARWLASQADTKKSHWWPCLMIKARPKVHQAQTGMFGLGVPKPPGKGWQRIPRGKRGGFRRRQGNKWTYWYPDTAAVQSAPHPEDVQAEAPPPAKLVVPSKIKEEVTEAMAAPRTKGERKSANSTALDIVQKAMKEKRGLTDVEALEVAGYTGKGGISGDLNQFYTPVEIAKAMWDVMGAYQDDLERVLEPSCGAGVLLQTAPAGAKVTGVELDNKSAMVAEALHGHKHQVESKAFEVFNIERAGVPQEFDAVIANPPYCVRTGDIPLHKPEFKSADQYFIDTSLDNVKDGGICMMLVHPGVMNNKTPGARDFREKLLARAEVVDSFRLPKTTFKHTHCEIPADIIVLRKRDSVVGNSLLRAIHKDTLQPTLTALGAWDGDFVAGDYFERHPDRILGTALTKEETGWRATVEGDASKVPGAMRQMTEDKIASGGLLTDPAAKRITVEALGELAQENEALKEAMSQAKDAIEADKVPPALGNTMNMAGSRYLYVGEPPKWVKMESVDDVTQIIESSGDEAIKEAHDIALELGSLIAARDSGEYYKARAMRRRTEKRVKDWVKENGIPGSHRALGELSKSAPPLLDFMACVDSNGELSDLLSKDAAVTLKAAEVDKSDLMSVANFVARRNKGYVTIDDIQHNWEGWESESEDEIRRAVMASGEYATDGGELQHLEDYLTGNLWDKLERDRGILEIAEEADVPPLERQIAALAERLETKRRSIDDVPIQLRVMSWMDPKWFNAYLNSPEGRKMVFGRRPLGPTDQRANMIFENGAHKLQWLAGPEGHDYISRIKNDRGGIDVEDRTAPEGTVIRTEVDSRNFLKYMNRLSLGPRSRDHIESIENDIQNGFSEWIKNSEYRAELEDLYNKTFTSEFRREYSGDELGLEGIRPGIVPHEFQNQAVRWAAETGRGILAQDVGLGKTFIAILLAKYRKQDGLARRPFVVVPKSVATNWSEEVETLFPGSKVLIIGEHRAKSRKKAAQAKKDAKDRGLTGEAAKKYIEENSWTTKSDNAIERNKKLAMVKQNEYDLIICTKPAFDRIPLKEATVKKFEDEDFWYERAGSIDAAKGGKTQETQDKKIAKLQAAWNGEKEAEKYKFAQDMVYWEDMDIDTLIADEAHAYKNLYGARSRMGNQPKFLGGSGQSKQARKMQHMSRVVRDKNPSNGVYMMTATPTKNSPLEIFNMLQHIAPEGFQAMGIQNSEEFIDRFCKLEERLVLTPPGRDKGEQRKKKRDLDGDDDSTQFSDEFEGTGNLESAMCVTGFTNLKELEGLMDRYMMLQTATDVGLKIPDANYATHLVEMTEDQKEVYAELRAEAHQLNPQEDPGGMFRIMDRMKKAAQDLELFDPEAFAGWYANSPKYQACVESAYEGAMSRGGQIVFCDHNASHNRLKAMLMAKGLKESEIGIINAKVAPDSTARQDIGNRFNRGEIKVVIGNTGTMGEGVNLQGKKRDLGTTDIHHLDQPWDPGTMHQRNGRGVRQGNRADQVDVHTYLSTGSFDGFRHSTLKGKERWLDKLRSGANDISNDMEGQDLDEVEMLAMLSDDPDAALETIKLKKADAQSAWYAKQSQDAINSFYNYQRKVQSLVKMKDESKTKGRLTADVARLKRQLLRHELLPVEVKTHLESGETAPVAIGTHMVGGDDNARLAANIMRAGDVITQEAGYAAGEQRRYVITRVNLADRKASVRSWGGTHSSPVDIDSLGAQYQTSPYREVDELKESLRESMDTSYRSPLEELAGFSEVTLDANRDMISESIREWHKKHGKSNEDLLVRDPGGQIVPLAAGLTEGKEIVYPWGKDAASVREAIVQSNASDERWESWDNPILSVARRAYGMSGYHDTPFKALASQAESIWKERQASESKEAAA